MKKNLLERLGGRKFIALFIVTFVGYSLVLLSFLNAEAYFQVVTVQWLGYGGLNVAQKALASKKEEQIIMGVPQTTPSN